MATMEVSPSCSSAWNLRLLFRIWARVNGTALLPGGIQPLPVTQRHISKTRANWTAIFLGREAHPIQTVTRREKHPTEPVPEALSSATPTRLDETRDPNRPGKGGGTLFGGSRECGKFEYRGGMSDLRGSQLPLF